MNPLAWIAGLFRRTDAGTHGRGDALSEFWYMDVGAGPTAARISVNESIALTYSGVWAATRLLAGTGGWLPLNLYRRDGDSRSVVSDDRRNILVHDQPNTEMEAMNFRAQAIQQQVNAGNCYSEIERDGRGFPVALWPIHHTRCRPVRDKESSGLYYEVKNDNAEPTYIEARDILHVRSMMSDDGITGKGVIRHARETIAMGIATEKYGAKWFGSGGIPRLLIEHPGKLSPDARSNFRKEWKEIYGGSDGDQVALLSEGAKPHPLNVNMEDSQFLSTRQHNVEEIARWYGVPPHMLQHLLRATYNNIEHQQIEFVIFSLIPWLKLWEQQLWAKLLTPEEQMEMFFEFNVNALMRGDAKSRSEFYQIMVFSGLMNPNEARALENMNPYQGGDVYVMQSAMLPIEDLGKQLQAKQSPAPQAESAALPMLVAHGMLQQSRDHAELLAVARSIAEAKPAESEVLAQIQSLREDLASLKAAADPREPILLSAAKSMLSGAVSRMLRKEATAARRAAAKPTAFLKWLDEFYSEDHIRNYEDAAAPPCTALQALGYNVCAKALAKTEADKSRQELLDLSGECTPALLGERVESCVSGWEQSRAESVVETVLGAKA